MSRHFWPTEPGDRNTTYLVEHQDGEMRLMHLDSDGSWRCVGLFRGATTDSLVQNGYLGVRTPFDEEAERAAFEAHFNGFDFSRDNAGRYCNKYTGATWQGWLAAKRQERGPHAE